MHGRGKSDGPVVPAKPPNNATVVAAEVVEEKGPAKGNAGSETRPGRRAGVSVCSELGRVRQVARKDKDFWIRRRTRLSAIRCSRNFSSHE
jgi:RNA-directed DNA polymerase